MKENIGIILAAIEDKAAKKAIGKELIKLVMNVAEDSYRVKSEWDRNRLQASEEEFVKVILSKNGL